MGEEGGVVEAAEEGPARRDRPIADAARAWGKALVEKRWRDAVTALDVLFGTLGNQSMMSRPGPTIDALERAAADLRKVTAERDFLKRREQSIIEATDPADGGQYRADIVSAIQRQRRDLDNARQEARLWKALARAERSLRTAPPTTMGHGFDDRRQLLALAAARKALRAIGVDPDAPEQG